jgi:hypothetical protein
MGPVAALSDDRSLLAPLPARQDAPDAAQLLTLVASYLRDELRPTAPAGQRFGLLVAANACAVVARELVSDFAPSHAAAACRTAALAAELRAGNHDHRLEELVDPLRAATRWRLTVAHSGWDAA